MNCTIHKYQDDTLPCPWPGCPNGMGFYNEIVVARPHCTADSVYTRTWYEARENGVVVNRWYAWELKHSHPERRIYLPGFWGVE